MDFSEYKIIYENEDSHFYYLANHGLILSLINKCKPQKKLKILDAGCGTGLLAKKLEIFGEVTGVDINDYAIKYSKLRGVKVKKASVDKLPFTKNAFDIVVSVDVIYHKQVKDKKALSEFMRVLKPGGILILRVPAISWLYRSCDRQVHTRERYNLDVLKYKIKGSGFNIKKITYINSLLLLPAIISFIIEKFKGSSRKHTPLTKLPNILNQTCAFLLSLEWYIIAKLNLPAGLGIIAVCQKPK